MKQCFAYHKQMNGLNYYCIAFDLVVSCSMIFNAVVSRQLNCIFVPSPENEVVGKYVVRGRHVSVGVFLELTKSHLDKRVNSLLHDFSFHFAFRIGLLHFCTGNSSKQLPWGKIINNILL